MTTVPKIGDVIISPHDNVLDESGAPILSLLPLDGTVTDLTPYPILDGSFEPQDWARNSELDFTIVTPLTANGTGFSDEDYFYIGSDGYIYRYDKEWNYVNTIPNTKDKYTYLRGIAFMKDLYPDHIFIAAGGSSRCISRQSLLTNSVTDYINTGIDMRGMMIKGEFVYIGDTANSRLKKYDSNLNFVSNITLSGYSGEIRSLMSTDNGFYLGTSTGAYEYNNDFELVSLLITTSAFAKGIFFHDHATGTKLYGTANGTNIYVSEKKSALPVMESKDPRCPYKMVANIPT